MELKKENIKDRLYDMKTRVTPTPLSDAEFNRKSTTKQFCAWFGQANGYKQDYMSAWNYLMGMTEDYLQEQWAMFNIERDA